MIRGQARIEDYALLGDLQTAALVDRDGTMAWLCLPRFDSPACFAALLGGLEAGFWRLRPAADPATLTARRYRGETLVLESVWECPDGAVRVVDFMPPRGAAPDVVRIVEGLRGSVPVRCELSVRFDYGHVVPWVRRQNGRWSAVAGPDSLWLDTPIRLEGQDHRTVAEFVVRGGESVPFVLTWSASYQEPPRPVDPHEALAQTQRFWRDWIGVCTYEGRYADAVRRSLLTLKALTYRPSGGIAAAATTSLPEEIGGSRNWDYRFCWLRDAAFTLQALAGAGYVAEAGAWRDWLLRAVAGDPGEPQIMYSLTGRRRLPEREIDWLTGYEGSRPVRVGNAATGQFQLDVYGEVLDCLHTARRAGLSRDDQAWQLQQVLTERLASVWRQPDNSLWEVRGPRRHFVHSKVMAWVGLDRMIRTARRAGLDAPLARWEAARDAVHAEVCARGYDPGRNTFTQFYGSRGLDAALLLIPRVRFLPPDDPRVHGTVDAVRHELMEDGLVLRYRTDSDRDSDRDSDLFTDPVEGLPGREGAFLACSFWLADACALTGRFDQARELFERLLTLTNDVGLLSEEWDPLAARQLGNTPQAFSHVGLVNTALALDRSPHHLTTESAAIPVR